MTNNSVGYLKHNPQLYTIHNIVGHIYGPQLYIPHNIMGHIYDVSGDTCGQ